MSLVVKSDCGVSEHVRHKSECSDACTTHNLEMSVKGTNMQRKEMRRLDRGNARAELSLYIVRIYMLQSIELFATFHRNYLVLFIHRLFMIIVE